MHRDKGSGKARRGYAIVVCIDWSHKMELSHCSNAALNADCVI